MKKTLIALMTLAGVACGAETMEWTGSTNYDLSNMSQITAATIENTSGWIITQTGNNTSPAPVVLTMSFTITQNPASVDQHLLSFGANAGSAQNAYGFTIKTNGMLEFGYMGTDNLTSGTDAVTTNSTCQVATLTLNTNYELTLVSKASKNSAGVPGRGSDNFAITLTNLATNEVVTKTSTGFALNGSYFANLRIGSNLSDDTNVLKGSVSSIHIYSPAPVPEPATATLSLLALAGLAARRRRG